MVGIICIILLILLVLLMILIYISNNVLKIKKYTISNSKIPSEFDNFKIVHISDVHSKIFGENNVKVIDKVKKLNPDMVIMSGDIIDKREKNIEDFFKMYEEIYSSYPTFYSIGNHERNIGYNKYKKYLNLLRDAGVHVIVNGSEKFFKNGVSITINALKFRENMQPKILTEEKENKFVAYMKNKLKHLDGNEFNILIAHDPENFDMYRKLEVDLIFSGHIHGGLIRFGKICLLSPRRKFFPKYSYGVNKKGTTTIVTTSGMGNASIPIRIFNRPEIVEVIIKK